MSFNFNWSTDEGGAEAVLGDAALRVCRSTSTRWHWETSTWDSDDTGTTTRSVSYRGTASSLQEGMAAAEAAYPSVARAWAAMNETEPVLSD